MKSTKTLIIAFIAVLIAVIVVGVIAAETIKYTKLSFQSDTIDFLGNNYSRHIGNSINQTTPYTLTKGLVTGTWRTGDGTCSIPTLALYNGSVATANLLTVGASDCSTGDYNYTANSGIVRLCNSSEWSGGTLPNTTIIEYHYCPDTYVSSTWGRTAMNVVPGFFVIGILVFAAFLIFKVIKEEGEGGIET